MRNTPRPRLTASSLKSAQPEDKPYELGSDRSPGLLLRVEASGTQTFWVQVARGKRHKLGNARTLTLAQAEDRARRVLVDPDAFIRDKHKADSLDDFLDKHYTPWAKAHHKTGESTGRRVKSVFGPKFCAQRLEEITVPALEKHRTTRLNAGLSDGTVNRDLAALSAVLSKAVEWGALEANPVHKVKPMKLSNEQVRFLSDAEQRRLLDALKARDATMRTKRASANHWRSKRARATLPTMGVFADHLTPLVLLSMHTGMRQGEAFELRWEDVDLDRRILTVRGKVAKSGKTRHIPLNTTAIEALETWQEITERDAGLVFPGKVEGKPFDNVKKAWAGLLEDAKIEGFRWHDLRHDFASRLVMGGVDLNTVRELLGHADIKMTLRYAHLAPEHKAAAVEKIAMGGWK
ncbi:phage integrase [Hydrogenophaga luteola]|uniref:Tyrosine-type recombinase/integrase n=1 Tax=Hydrogenophaga luteola TaxID=1591122 RepID=A0ABV7W2Z2_9BURK